MISDSGLLFLGHPVCSYTFCYMYSIKINQSINHFSIDTVTDDVHTTSLK